MPSKPFLRIASIVLLAMGALPALSDAPTAPPAPESFPPVVEAGWLAERLKDPLLVVLDARPGLKEYLAQHIPGAQTLQVENLRSSAGGVPGMLASPEALRMIAGRLGIDRKSRVVVYGSETDPDAAFVATALRIAGVERVAILDGGFARWLAEKRETTGARPSVRVTMPALTADPGAVATIEEVGRAAETHDAILVDARPQEQFDAGRIPGAVSRFWKKDRLPDGDPGAGSMRPIGQLAREYEALGVVRDRPVIVYCNTGHMASAVYWDLRHVLGYPLVSSSTVRGSSGLRTPHSRSRKVRLRR